ncbi:MAG: PEPxxWA-CTERM sorting domain-containing protein [Parasphingorhabdus sp.]|uniref:PEPxxWA-CTERM sorting domain-containing protein n=1 Tax=Parasphingorhabdus sp. TaxID=2709688 RepID=UPI003299A0F0
MKKILLASAVMAAAGMTAPAQAANILANGDFESGDLSPWFQDREFGGTVDWAAGSSFARTGAFGAGNFGNFELRQDFAGVAASSITEASIWVRHMNSAGGAAVAFAFFYDDSTEDQFVLSTSSADYEFFDLTSQLDLSKTLVAFSLFGNSGANVEAAIDDAQILTAMGAVPEPATWAFMIFGFGAIGSAMRRQRKVNVKVSYA